MALMLLRVGGLLSSENLTGIYNVNKYSIVMNSKGLLVGVGVEIQET